MLNLGIVADEISRDFREAVNIGLQAGLIADNIRMYTTTISLCLRACLYAG